MARRKKAKEGKTRLLTKNNLKGLKLSRAATLFVSPSLCLLVEIKTILETFTTFAC